MVSLRSFRQLSFLYKTALQIVLCVYLCGYYITAAPIYDIEEYQHNLSCEHMRL